MPKVIRRCEGCRRPLPVRARPDMRFCSGDCRAKGRRQRQARKRHCEGCGRRIAGDRREDARFCGGACRQQAYLARQHVNRKAVPHDDSVKRLADRFRPSAPGTTLYRVRTQTTSGGLITWLRAEPRAGFDALANELFTEDEARSLKSFFDAIHAGSTARVAATPNEAVLRRSPFGDFRELATDLPFPIVGFYEDDV